MKELSIEDKAKRYDEAIEIAKKFYNDEGCRVGMTPIDLEVIFPELIESEDERIRKEMLQIAEESEDSFYMVLTPNKRETLIAWLEKQNNADKVKQQQTIEIPFGAKDSELQEATYYIPEGYHAEINGNEVIIKKGEQKTTWKPTEKQMDKPLFTYDDILALQCCMETSKKVQEDKKLYEQLQSLHDRLHDAYWLEKQGEQKPFDKVKPKFKTGQWIVWQDKCYKVNHNGCGYELVDQNGLSTSLEYGTIDKNAHLWDITKDAKDGDVLVHSSFMFDDFIFIYNNTSNLQAYCYYSKERNRFIIEDRGHHCPWNMQEVTPATKEQRDLLFSKMKEEGYEWSDKIENL